METKTLRVFKIVLIPLLIATGLVWYYEFQTSRHFEFRIDFFDVGQGDGMMITTYEGNQVLVDGGPGSNMMEGLGRRMPFFDRQIEMIVLTHPHADHLDGFIPVLRRYQVKKVLLPNLGYKSENYTELLNEIKREGAEVIYAVQGQRIWLDKSTVMDVMHPLSGDLVPVGKNDDLNDFSIVSRVMFGKTKILLTGDSGSNVEAQLLPMFNLDSDLLKVGHHGSKYSTSQAFVDEVTPEFSVIQSGENNYGHPNEDVIARLEAVGSRVLRNDQSGDIRFISDGSRLRLVE